MSKYVRLDLRCKCGRLGAGRKDGLCSGCRLKITRYTAKYTWTPELDAMLRDAYANLSQRRSELRDRLDLIVARTGFSRPAVHYRATLLGLRRDQRRKWTLEDKQKLEQMAGNYTVLSIANRLGINVTSVVAMMDHMSLRRRVASGYSKPDLAQCFGVTHHKVTKWERMRLIVANPETGRFSDAAVKRFIEHHPQEYSLRRVDELWFKGMIARNCAYLESAGLDARQEEVA